MAHPSRTVREQFLVELTDQVLAELGSLTALNELFTAWVETVYHQRVHSETGQTPLARFTAVDPPALPDPARLREAFLWSEHRLVAKTATVSLHGNTYEVDAALVGRRVELVFDPFDLATLSVRYQDRDMGTAVPHRIGRHVHPAAKPDTSPGPAPATGIDYLGLVHHRHTAALSRRVDYAALGSSTTDEEPDGDAEAEFASLSEPAGEVAGVIADLAAIAEADPDDPDQLDMLTLLEEQDNHR